ncbi:MAG: tRNA uridine-5-carboxymethylaminomethyl(34) synthesis GTPase MnmE [Synechococcus sp. TMED19]|nr:MAG: tRNA uridine-5-carboxymethylaminomethyl(34) synthesis GTPase MnmE [Synechococcus sp. TMED19]
MSLAASGDTIAAIATAVAAGAGSVAIVRVSGPQAEAIGRSLFLPAGHQVWESHRILYGHVQDPANGEMVDEVLLLLMQAPRSFTRETVVEFHGHGGLVAVQRLLQLVLEAGARRALPGEFSQRAFLHGRLDLTRAEAISELVSARSQRAAQLAIAGLDGGLQQKIDALRNQLLDQLAELEARVDFEESLPPLNGSSVQDAMGVVQQELMQLVTDAERARLLRDGARVAIVGRPNVGKSSLLNALSRSERAIVTDLPGTTRDLLDCDLVLQGVPITLLDTAGIRQTSDKVEQLGIERSRAALASADAVLLLHDISCGWSQEDQQLLETVPEGVPLLRVGNKADLAPENEPTPGVVAISARDGEGLELLERELLRCCGHSSDGGSLQVALNQRQCDLAKTAVAALERSLEAAQQELPWDFWTIDLRDAIRALGEITGAEISEAVLDRVFSRFCIGK